MRIQYCSDLHLDFPENKKFLEQNPISTVGDILILAGDIVPFAFLEQHLDFFKYLSDNFEITYWLPGNHEYYHSDAAMQSGSFIENILSNVHLVNNMVIEKNNIRLIFATLWTQISKLNEWWIPALEIRRQFIATL
jgi:predicted phosphohydrolase